MKDPQLMLSDDFLMSAIDYAGQGNAILGIRDSGKTYGAMKCAEQLMDAGIPIIVFDPIGVWKNLKIGTGKHEGYPIVTAGGEGCDIKLTKENAVEIVSAAMKEGISLVVDFYSPELMYKATWINIVQNVVEELMYKNKEYGMRHIFIEEAAEVIPQVIKPQHNKVYAAIESLARMGRNAGLGYTIINQRAEQINKAILELCNMSLLHKQKGKNSLTSIKKWMDIIEAPNVAEIMKTLPSLGKGQCWVIGDHYQPQLIQVTPKKTFHPDPKNNKATIEASKKTVDVSGFVTKMKKLLEKPAVEKKNKVELKLIPARTSTLEIATEALLKQEIISLTQQAKDSKLALERANNVISSAENTIAGMQKYIDTLREKITDIFGKVELVFDGVKKKYPTDFSEMVKTFRTTVKEKYHVKENMAIVKDNKDKVSLSMQRETQGHNNLSFEVNNFGRLGKCAKSIITFLCTYPKNSFTKVQISVMTNYSAKSSGFQNALSELNVDGFILKNGGEICANTERLNGWDFLKPEYNVDTIKRNLGKCEREIYQFLINNPNNEFSKQELADRTNYSISSSGFQNAISRLNTLELINKIHGGDISLDRYLLELM